MSTILPHHDHNSDGLPERDLASCAPSFHEELLNNLYDGVYFVNKDRQLTFWNHSAECLTGYSHDQAVGRHCYDNFLKHAD
jgi:PAS domain S-box-containing protein